jgi:hypothetical protein
MGTNFQFCLNAGTNTTMEVTGLKEGETNTVAVAAYDSDGNISPPSYVITLIVPAPGEVRIVAAPGPGSPAVLSFTVEAGRSYKLEASTDLINWSVEAGRSYKLEASTDLINWSVIWETATTNDEWIQLEDNESAGLPMRFYRLSLSR